MSTTGQDAPAPLRGMAGRRRALGISQAELARRCGVTRQFANMVESGRTPPNVQVALRLAAELRTTVEELFGARAEPAAEVARVTLLEDAAPAPGRVNLAWAGRRWVGHRADTAASLGGGFQEADAVVARDAGDAWRATVARGKTLADMRHNIAIAGCDPALALLADGRVGAGLPGHCFWVNCGSGRALQLLADGAVHIAGLHSGNGRSEENLRELRRRDPRGRWRLVRFTQWEQGWMARPGVPGKFSGREILEARRLRLANRERGSGSRGWIDGQLRALGMAGELVPGYGREFASHWECARALLHDEADVAAGPRAVAELAGLEFLPDNLVAFDLIIPCALLGEPRVAALLEELRARRLRGEIESLPGYRADEAGRLV